MKKYIPIIMGGIFLVLVAGCAEKPIATDIAGNPVRMSDYAGKWMLINYWADWCATCLEELPQLNKFYALHQNKDAVILGVNSDNLSRSQIKEFVTQHHILYPMLVDDPANILGLQPITVLPTTIVISPQGKISATLLGAQTVQSLEKIIQ